MKRSLMLLLSLVALGPTAELLAQRPQREIAQALRGRDRSAVARALGDAVGIPAGDRGVELRDALRAALVAEMETQRARYHRGRRGGQNRVLVYPEMVFSLVRAVVELGDPESIPALAAALSTGGNAVNALVAFGPAVIPVVVGVVNSPEGTPSEAVGGLIALRKIVEQAGTGQLSAHEHRLSREAASRHLGATDGTYFSHFLFAIDLAVALDDPELREVVRTVSVSDAAIRGRGITDPEIIAMVKKRALDRLAGIPALPRQ